MIVEKKSWPSEFGSIRSGAKRFDARLADWRCRPGDTLVLREWNPKTRRYTGRVVRKKVRYVVKTKSFKYFTKKEINKYGLQIIGF